MVAGRVVRCWWVALVVILMAGCAAPTKKPVKRLVMPVQKPAVVAPAPAVDRQLAYMLSAGERALAAGRLATPEDDNAVYWFQAVLRQQPGNVQASTGLQQVIVHYAQWAREALAAGKPDQAGVYLQRGLRVAPGNPLLLGLQAEVGKARSLSRQREASTDNSVRVSSGQLAAQSPELLAELQRVALLARERNAMVLITARTDAEGRWMYQKMREAVPGYRLRGDIQPGSAPRVSVMTRSQ